jgi:hypothetical protein
MPQSGDGTPSCRFTYGFGPFAFCSDIELPELPVLSVAQDIPVRVMLGATPQAVEHPTFAGQFCTASHSEFLLRIPDIADYYVSNGSEITVQPCPHAAPLDVRGFLLGNVFAVLCHQRRLLPLHASAVRMGGGVVAFLGASGAGKSTLAAYLSGAGYPVVSDDICLLDPSAPAESRVIPVAPWLKLWRASLEALGHSTDDLQQTFTDEDKFRLPASRFPAFSEAEAGITSGGEGRLPLRAVIVLERREVGSPRLGATLEVLRPVQAIAQMMQFTYQAFLLDWLGLKAEHFTSCGKGLEGATAYTCIRNWTFDSLPDVLDCLQKEFP